MSLGDNFEIANLAKMVRKTSSDFVYVAPSTDLKNSINVPHATSSLWNSALRRCGIPSPIAYDRPAFDSSAATGRPNRDCSKGAATSHDGICGSSAIRVPRNIGCAVGLAVTPERSGEELFAPEPTFPLGDHCPWTGWVYLHTPGGGVSGEDTPAPATWLASDEEEEPRAKGELETEWLEWLNSGDVGMGDICRGELSKRDGDETRALEGSLFLLYTSGVNAAEPGSEA